jgi:hypothetical protein
MMSEPSTSRITTHVTEDPEHWFIHRFVAVQRAFPVLKIRIDDAGSLKKVIEPVIEQAEAAAYRMSGHRVATLPRARLAMAGRSNLSNVSTGKKTMESTVIAYRVAQDIEERRQWPTFM